MTREKTNKCSMYICEAGATPGGTPVTQLVDTTNGISAEVTTNKYKSATTDFFKELAVGMRITVAGFVTAGNNGESTITAISANYKEITVDRTLATEAATGSLTSADPGIAAVASTKKFTCASENFFASIAAGMKLVTTGFSTPANNGTFTVVSVDEDKQGIVVSETVADDSADTDANIAYTAAQVTVTPVWFPIRFTGESLQFNPETKQSDEILDSRDVQENYTVFESSGGATNHVLSFPRDSGVNNAYGRILEGLLENPFVANSVTAGATSNVITLATSESVSTITAATAGRLDDFVVNQYIRIASAYNTANNGIYLITAKDAPGTVLTVTKPYLASWAGFTTEASETAVITGCYARNGETRKAFNIEKRYNTIGKYEYFKYLRVTSCNININTRNEVTLDFNFTGAKPVTGSASIAGSNASASTQTVIRAGANVGYLLENGVSLTEAVKQVTININNNPNNVEDVRQNWPVDVDFGQCVVSGTINCSFDDLDLYNKSLNSEASSLVIMLDDTSTFGSGDVMIITIHKVKLAGGPNIPAAGQNVPLNLKFAAEIYDSTRKTIQIDLLAA